MAVRAGTPLGISVQALSDAAGHQGWNAWHGVDAKLLCCLHGKVPWPAAMTGFSVPAGAIHLAS